MSDFLERMRRGSEDRLAASVRATPLEAQMERARRIRVRALDVGGFSVFAEVKPSSPSEGSFPARDPVEVATSYEDAGASAISVLTEPDAFGGSLDMLSAVAGAVNIPVMRKDFLVDPYQIWEGRAFGASGVLIIARMFDRAGLGDMVEAARNAGVFALVEAFDRADIDAIADVASDEIVVGINARDLETLEVRPDAHDRLASHLPSGVHAIAESGISSPMDVKARAAMGYDGVLVGSSLMRADTPEELLRSMVLATAEEKSR